MISDFFCNPTLAQYLALRLGAALFVAVLVVGYLLAVPYRRAGLAYVEGPAVEPVSAEVIVLAERRGWETEWRIAA